MVMGNAEILIVDDHSLVLEGICSVVGKIPGVVVADAVTSGISAKRLIESRDYDIYILDVSIPDLSGFDLINLIRKNNEKARIIVNTMHEEVWMINRLVACHVNAVILKTSAVADLKNAIDSVLHGETYTCPRFSSICHKLERMSGKWLPNDMPTRREQEVLEAIAQGLNSHEIAMKLKISENTVETYRKKLIAKFDARNAIDMVVQAVERGWIKAKSDKK